MAAERGWCHEKQLHSGSITYFSTSSQTPIMPFPMLSPSLCLSLQLEAETICVKGTHTPES